MMNGRLVSERTKEDLVNNAVTRIAVLTRESDAALDAIYWATLTRRPSSQEREYFGSRLLEKTGDLRHRVLEDVAWTLLNSQEFLVNH